MSAESAGFVGYLVNMRNPLKQASETMEELQVAARSVTATSEIASVALLAVVSLSLAAFLVALVALERTARNDRD